MEIHLLQPSQMDDVVAVSALAYLDDFPGWSLEAARDEAYYVFSEMFLTEGQRLRVVVAEEQGQIIGGAVVRESFLNESSYDMSWVFVDKAWRRRGVATALVTEALRMIDEDMLCGVMGTVHICVWPHNEPFYTRFGFMRGSLTHDGFVMTRICNAQGPHNTLSSRYDMQPSK